MGMFFLGILRSGSVEMLRAQLRGLDVEIAPFPGLSPDDPSAPVPDVPDAEGIDWHGAPGYLQLIIREEWPRETWSRAAAIARGESGFNPNAWNQAGEDSRGLWQINVVPQANIDLLALGDLFDPRINARAAVAVWRRQGWRAWQNVAISLGIPLTGPGIP